MNEDSRERFACNCLREGTRNPSKDGQKWPMWNFIHAHKAEHRQEHSMAVVCVTQSRGLGEINDCDNSDVFRTVCLLEGLLLNSCSKSCGSGMKGKIVSCQAPKPDSSNTGKEGKFACCWWFHCESTLTQPLWSFKNVKSLSRTLSFHCLGSWNAIKIHFLHSCVKGS